MKKQLLTFVAALMTFALHAQQATKDSANTEAGYTKNVWYNLETGTKYTDSSSNWDFAVGATTSQGSSLTTAIHFNPKMGKLYEIDSAASQFSTVFDTTGISSWAALYNSDTSWAVGAFNNTTNLGSFDYGWGTYNMTTHNLDANRIFLIKYTSGEVKKLLISMLSVQGNYVFTHANLDNTDSYSDTVSVANYSGKNFFYVSLKQHLVKDREPNTANWDLWFGQYTSSSEPYMNSYEQTVTGVLGNVGVEIAQIQLTDSISAVNYTSYGPATFSNHINTIGWDWKGYVIGGNGVTYVTNDSVVYFVKKADGDIWKLQLTKFGWSATGIYYFSKTKLFATSISNTEQKLVATIALYPNPSTGGNVNLVYSFGQPVAQAQMLITDIAGRTVLSQPLSYASGLQQHIIHTSDLQSGIYIVNLITEKGSTQQKLIVQ